MLEKIVGKSIKLNAKNFFIIETCFFLILLLIGITGSSINSAGDYGIVDVIKSNSVISKRSFINPYRGDECFVTTPYAISQYYSNPRFAPVNKNYGIEGRNMGMVHDVGAPVKSFYSIAKPATWGFFFFDLKRALSWYWLIPIYLCLNGMWLLLNIFFPKQEKINFVLALAATFAPSCAVWGFWPSYQLAFGVFASITFFKLLLATDRRNSVIYAILNGLSVSGLILTLYVPRIVPIMVFCFFIGIGYILKNRLFSELVKKIPYILISFLVIILIVGNWWLENYIPINRVLSSVYPGERKITGGGFNIVDSLRGFLMPFSIVFTELLQSDRNFYERIISFNIIIPLIVYSLFYINVFKKNIYYVVFLAFILFIMVYQLVGFPSWFAEITLFTRTFEYRVDFMIDIAIIFIIALFYFENGCKKECSKLKAICFSLILLIILVCLIINTVSEDYLVLFKTYSSFSYWIFFIFCIMFYFLFKNIKHFIYLYFIFFFMISCNFNAITIAPDKIASRYEYEKLNTDVYKGRVLLILANYFEGNLLAATGVPVLNATQNYIDNEILHTIYNDNQEYNRFNHIKCNFNSEVENIEFKLEQADLISWKINPYNYDFSKLPIDRLVVSKNEINPDTNSSLRYLTENDSYWIYQVIHSNNN